MKKERKYKEEYIDISGVTHYLLHYQCKPEAPVLLFIHGGPGQSESAIAYMVEEYVERNYNIVYYDQRGAGKTYLKNKKIKPNTEALKQDLLEIVCYLKKLYKNQCTLSFRMFKNKRKHKKRIPSAQAVSLAFMFSFLFILQK